MLRASEEGSDQARDQLLELVYTELHSLAKAQMRAERPDHTLSATALVNETYLKLFRKLDQSEGAASPWSGRAGFYVAAVSAMRRILIDHARARATEKRGGAASGRRERVPLDVLEAAEELEADVLVSLDEAISRLLEIDERAATVVRLRFYGGLQQAEIGKLLGVTERTIKRDWQFARAWLHEQLAENHEQDSRD